MSEFISDSNLVMLEGMAPTSLELRALDSEANLICACWMDEDNTKSLLGNLKVNDFQTKIGQLQFEVVQESWRRYRDVSPMSIRKISGEMGGAYLDSYGFLMEEFSKGIGSGVGPGQMRALMQQVSEETARETLITSLGEAQEALMNREFTLSEAQAKTAELLYKAGSSRTRAKAQSWDEGFAALEEKAQKKLEARAAGKVITEFLPTGMGPLDEIIQGIGIPEFCILAARPGVGKTAAALQIATYIAEHCGPVLFLSLELSKEVCWKRIACQQLRMPVKEFEENPELIRKVRERNIRLFIDDSPLKANRIHARVELFLSEQPGACLIIADQLSKMVENSADYKQMTQGCNQCCAVTNDLKIPFVLLTQVGRKGDAREKSRPTISDLKATGALEEDARKVIFIYREWVHNPGKCDPKGAEFMVAKNGDGESGDAGMHFDGRTYTFSTPPPTEFKPRKKKGKNDDPPPPSDADAPGLEQKMF